MAEPVPHRPGFVPGAIRRAFHHVRRDHRYFCVVLGRPGRGVRRQTDDVRRARALPAGYLRLRRSVAARTALPADARDLCPARVRLSAVRLFFFGLDRLCRAQERPRKGRRLGLVRIYRRTQRPRGLLFQLGHRAHRQYQYAVDIRILGFAGGVFRLGDEQVAETACRCGRYP